VKQRTDERFLMDRRAEREVRASKCVNEFKGKGQRDKPEACPFSHKITDDDRKTPRLKKVISDKEVLFKKPKGNLHRAAAGDKNLRTLNQAKEIQALKEEFIELKQLLLQSVRP
jgi:hypothetical protein